MRPLLVLCCLSVALAAAAEPVPCIVLNGRAYAPRGAVPDAPTLPTDRRIMRDQEYVAIRAVAGACGGCIVWGGGPDAHCCLSLPDRELFCRLFEARAYWRHLEPGGIDWWHVGAKLPPPPAPRTPRVRQAQRTPPVRVVRQPQRRPTLPRYYSGTSYTSGGGGGGSVHVRGHWRSTPSGGRTWVRSHTRSAPRR